MVSNQYPGRYTPSDLVKPILPNVKMNAGQKAGLKALELPYADQDSAWDKKFLNSEAGTQFKQALTDFESGKRGASIKGITLRGKTPEEIHDMLIETRGFKFIQDAIIPPGVSVGEYASRDGGITKDKDSENAVPIFIYYHPDLATVRVKPMGTPIDGSGRKKSPAPEPQVSINILLKNPFEGGNKEPNLSYDNEAFKVTESGFPIPKGPSQKFGFRMFHEGENLTPEQKDDQASWVATLMGNVHIPVSTKFVWGKRTCGYYCSDHSCKTQATAIACLYKCPLDQVLPCKKTYLVQGK
ncbi:MAG: hypothetical protein ACRCYP_02600 [Alphaproteobacteria bacterium]